MFTGIIDHCGKVLEVQGFPAATRIRIQSRFSDLQVGESVSVDGCCLTLMSPAQGDTSEFDISPETLKLTRALDWKVGTSVNLERALRLSDRLGGHIVSGHIDQRGKVLERETLGDGKFVRFLFGGVSAHHQRFISKKGSIAVNGVSLTVNEVRGDTFEVMLVPHTLERTNLKELRVNDAINLEFDWMAKLILKRVEEIHETLVPR